MTTRRFGRDENNDRGLAAVEFALLLPLLAMLFAGIIEFGMTWHDSLVVSGGTRAAARVVANMGDARLSDYEALVSVDSALGAMSSSNVTGVLIFDAATSGGAVPAACLDTTGEPQSIIGVCNYYTATMISTMTVADFDGASATACSATAWDRYWCPTTRQTTQGAGLSTVGIWVRARRDWVTGVFPGSGLTVQHRTVMKVEPRP